MKWFTADTHFAHDAIAKLRGFEGSEMHDETLLSLINLHVKPEDTLFILGDFAWVKPSKYKLQIACKTVYLIMGNHDKKQLSQRAFGGNLRSDMATKVLTHHAWLSHYPHAYWPSSHHGSFHLYGHMHGEYEGKLNLAYPGRRSLDVGPDNANRLLGSPRPFSEEEIYGLLMSREGHHFPTKK